MTVSGRINLNEKNGNNSNQYDTQVHSKYKEMVTLKKWSSTVYFILGKTRKYI